MIVIFNIVVSRLSGLKATYTPSRSMQIMRTVP